jgi:hypothetical protein
MLFCRYQISVDSESIYGFTHLVNQYSQRLSPRRERNGVANLQAVEMIAPDLLQVPSRADLVRENNTPSRF